MRHPPYTSKFLNRVLAHGLVYLALMLGASALAYFLAGVSPRPVSFLVVGTGSLGAAILLAVVLQRLKETERSLARRTVALEGAVKHLQDELDEHDRDRAELAVRNAELHGVLDAASQVSIIATDQRGTITVFNSGAENLLGFTAEEMIGKATPETFHLAAEIRAHEDVLRQEHGIEAQGFEVLVALARTGRHDTREWTYVRKDGRNLQVELSVTARRDVDGRLIGFLGIAVDITDRITAQEALLHSEAKLEAILDTAVDGIFTVDVLGIIRSANLAAARIFGYAPEELEGRPLTDLMPEPHRTLHPQYMANYLTLGVTRVIGKGGREVPGRRRDGSLVDLELAVSVLRSGGEVLFTGILRDISQRKADREALETAHRKLASRQAEVDRDLSMAAAIQQTMLPQGDVCFAGLDAAWSYHPSRIVGGDWFSLFALDGDHAAACLVDVSGHGVAPALVSTSLAHALRPGSALWDSAIPEEAFAAPEEILARLEREYPLERFNMFFTMICLILHIPSGRLRYANAGHPPPLLLCGDGRMEHLDVGGPMIGLGLPQQGGVLTLCEGDSLLLYTDGCIDHQDEDGVQFGTEGMKQVMTAPGGKEAKDVIKRLEEALRAHGASWDPEDDLSMICLRYTPITRC